MTEPVRPILCPTSVAGMLLATISGAVFVVVLLADIAGFHVNPYLGVFFFMIAPMVFVLGLVLIPFGPWRERRCRASGKNPSAVRWPHLALNNSRPRTAVIAVLALPAASTLIVSPAAFSGI